MQLGTTRVVPSTLTSASLKLACVLSLTRAQVANIITRPDAIDVYLHPLDKSPNLRPILLNNFAMLPGSAVTREEAELVGPAWLQVAPGRLALLDQVGADTG